MDVSLMTEGTYPHGYGGVSVWCDQLVRGLSRHRFHVVALVASGTEPLAWELPENVASLTLVPLWGNGSRSRRVGRAAQRRFTTLFAELVESLMGQGHQQRFAEVLHELHDLGELTSLMRRESTVRTLRDVWSRRLTGTRATIADAVTAVDLLEHSLRPLSASVPRTAVSHSVANGLAVLPALAAKWRYGTPLLLTEHGIYLRERYLGYRGSPYRWPVKALHLAFLRQLCSLAYTSAGLIAPGNVYNKRWEERLGADPALIRTVYNGVDPADFPAASSEPPVPTISWAGRLDPIKDLETLIRSFALVHKEIPAAVLRIFGGVPKGGESYVDRCKALVAELGLSEVVHFEGRVEFIRDAYLAGSVVVLSSISEGFPYTLIEAMTCARPCVGTDVGGVPEALGDTGIVVPPRDPAAMASACVSLLRSPSQRALLGAAARQRALELFTVDQAIGTFDTLYSELTAPTPARPLLPHLVSR
ncbi:GT4 family glycosyltransferase PelF [Allokutzneria multivorans]|uniref:GT4 family glycosyltransferase PelF n=1 Tax=Allokutzneria multivorans TaxID=1142134 RepID=A0ABP7S9Q8_9PSEU